MQDFQPTTSGQQFTRALQHSSSLFTPKRVGFTLAGAFLFAGTATAAIMTVGSATPTAGSHGPARSLMVQSSAPETTPPAPSPGNQTSPSVSATTRFSASTDGSGKTDVHLNVNGQDVPVPQNGNSSQTIQNSNGSSTTVDVNGNTQTVGGSDNNSTSSFSVNVNSSSVSVGGDQTSP